MNIVVSLDGVLSGPTGDLVQKGLIVYRAFKQMGRVVLLTEMPLQRAEGWLMINNINDYDDLIDSSVEIDPHEDLRERQLEVVMSRGPVSLYVDSDPQRSTLALSKGISTLLFAESEYAHFRFRPDVPKSVRPWDEVVAERTRQQALIATDKRAQPVEMGLWE
jgi:hypothetical protein